MLLVLFIDSFAQAIVNLSFFLLSLITKNISSHKVGGRSRLSLPFPGNRPAEYCNHVK